MNMKCRRTIFAVLFALTPLLSCAVYAAIQGMALWDISPFTSAGITWNDEVFYYKQIEGITLFGMPQGYFGYNESIAQIGTLGAWSPFLLYPYAFLGKLFGISPHHILWFNLFFLSVSFLIFFTLAKPNLGQSLVLVLMFIAVPSYLRYTISSMVEAFFFASIIVFAGLLVKFARNEYGLKSLLFSYTLILYLSICRPYFLIFLIIPLYYHYKLNRWSAVLSGIVSVAAFLCLYLFFVQPRSAAYFFPLIDTEMFSVLKEEGFLSFVSFVFLKLFNGLKTIAKLMLQSMSEPNAFASIYALFFFLVAVTFIVFCLKLRNRRQKQSAQYAPALMALLICAAILLAIVLFYSIQMGSRHLIVLCLFLQFTVVCLFSVPVKALAAITVAIGLLSWSAFGDRFIFSLPKAGEDVLFPDLVLEDAELLSDAFSVKDSDNRWDNTVVYCYPSTNWSYCYFLPKGVGVELVLDMYALENCSELKSGYVLAAPQDAYDEIFTDAGWEALVTGRDFILYRRQ